MRDPAEGLVEVPEEHGPGVVRITTEDGGWQQFYFNDGTQASRMHEAVRCAEAIKAAIRIAVTRALSRGKGKGGK